MVAIRLASLLIIFISSGTVRLQNIPHYDELVGMVEARFHQNFVDNFTTPILDLQTWLNPKDYLDYHRQTFGKYSENPLLLNAVRHFSLKNVCTWLSPNVSINCCTDIKIIFLSLISKEMWAIKMIDSFGKPPSGLLQGDTFFPGSYDECLNLTSVYESFRAGVHRRHKWFNPKYCQIGIHIPRLTSLWNPKGLLKIGICIPDSCTVSDIKYLYDAGTSAIPFSFGDKQQTFVCHEEQKYNVQEIIPLAVCCLIVSLLILGTLYDITSAQLSKNQKNSVPAKQRLGPESFEMTSIKQMPNLKGNKTKITIIKQTPNPNMNEAGIISIKQMPNPDVQKAEITIQQTPDLNVNKAKITNIKQTPNPNVNKAEITNIKQTPNPDVMKAEITNIKQMPNPDGNKAEITNIKQTPNPDVMKAEITNIKQTPNPDRNKAEITNIKQTPNPDVMKAEITNIKQTPNPDGNKAEITNIKQTPNPDVMKAEITNIKQTPNPDGNKAEITNIKQTPNPNRNTTKLEPTQPTREPGRLGKFLLCFSVYKNASKLLNTDLPKDNLAPVHGIRFFSMTWIILGHTYFFGALVSRNNYAFVKNLKTFSFQAIGNASVSVDSFFLLSGMLVVYSGLKAMKKEFGIRKWLYFYFHRFWRLTPTYMLVMMVHITLFQHLGNGPYWPENGVEENYCRHNWWQNFLYINNFFDKQCMGWMWYLANDVQFFVFSPIILILLKKKPIGGLILLFLLLVGHFIGTAFLWLSKKRDPKFGFTPDIYMRPYTRVGPYLIGMAYGYLLHKINGKVAINRFLSVFLWLLATASAASVLYGLYDNYNGRLMTKEVAATYWAVNRSVWAIAVGYVICACVNGHGGIVNRLLCYAPFVPLSRLTYCAYLVHPIVMFSYFLRQRFPIYLTNFHAAHIYLAHMCVSYIVAFVVSMAFEAPIIALEKLLWTRNKSTTKS